MPIDPSRLRTGGAFAGPLARAALPAAPPPRELAPGARVGPFRIERELARGGMAIVYVAERDDGEFHQRVALKWMAGTLERDLAEALFRRERDIVASLDHPSIARLIDGGRGADDALWFAMELVEGETVERWCERERAPLALRVRLVRDLCDALAYAHARLLIHRDIKPSNVLVGSDGRVRLLDFGIATLAGQADLRGRRAMTPGYASPEQWAGDEVTVASDVYQAGLLLAHLVGVLRAPPPGAHATSAVGQAAPDRPAPLPESALHRVPAELASILRRATAERPGARYESIAAFSDELQRWLRREPVAAHRRDVLYRLQCRMRRHPVAAGLAAAGMLALALLGWRLALERDAARAEADRAIAQAARADAALDFLNGLFDWAAPSRHQGRAVTVEEALARGVEQLREPDTAALPRAELLYLLGRVHAQRREPERAIPLFEEVLALTRDLPGEVFLHAATATRLANMLGAEDRARSIALLGDSIAAMEGRDDEESVRLRVASRRFLAAQRYQSDDLAGGLETIELALRDGSAHLPPDDDELFHVRRELGTQRGAAGDLEAMLALRRENLALAERSLDPGHPNTIDQRLSLILALVQLDRSAEARPLLEPTRAQQLRLWGPAHASYAHLLYIEGLLELAESRPAVAARVLDQALEVASGAGLAGRGYLSRVLVARAGAALALGDPAAAETLLRRALDPGLQGRSQARDFGRYRLDLVRVLREQGRDAEIAALLDQVESEARPLPSGHLRHLQIELERAHLMAGRGEVEAASAVLARARAQLERTPPQRDRRSAQEIADALARRLGRA